MTSTSNSVSLDNILQNKLDSEKIPENSPIGLFCSFKNEINNQNENGWTPIYRCVLSNNLEALGELLKLGANPNIPNNMNETPLYQSVDMENYDALIILLKYNADCNISKKNGNTPLHLASQKLNFNFISALLRYGANPNLQNKLYNQTPVHIAISQKCEKEIVEIFFKYKGEIYDIKDKYDKTPFDYAIENGDEYKKMVEKIYNNNENNDIKNECNDDNLINENKENIINDYEKNSFKIQIEKEETPKKNDNNTIKFSEKFSSSELIKGQEDFNTSKSKLVFIKDESNNNSSSTNKNKKIVKNIITQTIMKINVNDDTSHFNLSTPKDLSKNIEENSNINLTQKNENINEEENINKEIKIEINPLEMINQVITNTNDISNENLKNNLNEQNNNFENKNLLKEEEENLEINDNKNYLPKNEILNDDILYQKSKSYIVSELPNLNQIKNDDKDDINEKSFSSFQNNKLNNFNTCNRILYHKMNVISNLNKEIENPNYIKVEENEEKENYNSNNSNNTNNQVSTPYIKKKNTYSKLNFHQNSNSSVSDINSHSFKESKLNNSNFQNSQFYSLNTTRQSSQYNSNSKRLSKPLIINKEMTNTLSNKINTQSYLNSYGSNLNLNNTSFTTSNTPLYNLHHKKSSLLSEYAFKNNQYNEFNNFNTTNENNYENFPSNEQITKLRNWLISCDLVSYLNLMIENNIFEIEKCVEGIKKGELNVIYKDIEDLGIKKPGHIFRFLLKLDIDAGLINEKIVNYLFSICNNTTTNGNLIISNNDYKACCFRNKNTQSNYNDIISFLESKNLAYLKEHFIHNGFESVDFIIIQAFSKYDFNFEILNEFLHIYNDEDKNKILKVIEREKRKICKLLNIPYRDKQNNLETTIENEQNCEMCNVF